jgi:hypothetical protein
VRPPFLSRTSRLIAALSLVGACAGTLGCPQSVPPTTSLRVFPADDAPKWARVTIDDQPIGALSTVAKRGVALPPGKHRITIEATGYFPWDAEVDAGEGGGLVKLDVKLVRVPD